MRKEIKVLGAIAIVVVVAALVGANYYRSSIQSERQPVSSADNPLVRPNSPTLGAADAPVTLVEFLDPECESCAAFSPVVQMMMKEYDGKIKLVVRYMPLHPNSMRAATLTEAAGEQGKYWQMQELLFQKQSDWGERHGAPTSAPKSDINVLFDKYAAELGLDRAKIDSAVKENRYQGKLERDRRDGQSLGVRQTPSFFVNGRKLARFGESDLRALIDDELKK